MWPDLLVDRRTVAEKRIIYSLDTLAIERNNIVSISQLVIKNVVDNSLRYGRQLDGDNIPLRQLFILIEIALKHGIKLGRRNLLQGKRDPWDLIQNIEKLDPGATDITDTVRQLSTVTTQQGRLRAWLRLAVMQKRLADYIKLLVDDKNLLDEYYEPEALMRSEEAVLLCGLLVSLNIVDCNICLKEEDLDGQEGVIDLTLYLRKKEDIGRVDIVEESLDSLSEMKTIIDQKSYVEEVNRNLIASLSNLQNRLDSLSNENAILREDVAIYKRKTETLEHENELLHTEVGKQSVRQTPDVHFHQLDPKREDEWEDKLQQLKESNQELEKELILEVQMKAEMEMAMKLLEKDVHEKQDTIISLRSQLEDIKTINLEMYTKLAECEKAITYKSDMIQKLEKKTFAMAETLEQLDKKYTDTEKSLQVSKAENQDLKVKVNSSHKNKTELEADVKIEREWRERLQESSVTDRETISSLKQDNEFLKQVSSDYDNLRQDNERLREQVRDGELTLEEMGQQLSWSKLQLSSLKDEANVATEWKEDSAASNCPLCAKEFSLARRKHHCRNCGGIFCAKCSDNQMNLPSSAKPVRVCDNCYTLVLGRQSTMLPKT